MPTMISNNIIRDPRLNYDEVGFLCQLLSLEKSYRYNMTALLSLHKTGKHKLYKMIAHLESLGYIRPHLFKDKTNRWNKSFVVNDNPDFYQMHSFTLINSDLFRNNQLSYKQVGLLIQLISLSLLENWNYTIEGLASLHNSGYSSIQSTLQQLKDMALVKTIFTREEGRIKGIKYECAYCYVKEKSGYFFVPSPKKKKESIIQIIQPTANVVIEHRAVYDENYLLQKEKRHEAIMSVVLERCHHKTKLNSSPQDIAVISKMINDNLLSNGIKYDELYKNGTDMLSLLTLQKAVIKNCESFERTPYFLFKATDTRLRNIIVLLNDSKNASSNIKAVMKAEKTASKVYKALSPQIKLLMHNNEEYIARLYDLAYASIDKDSSITRPVDYISKIINNELEQEAFEKYIAPIKLLTHFETVEQSSEYQVIS